MKRQSRPDTTESVTPLETTAQKSLADVCHQTVLKLRNKSSYQFLSEDDFTNRLVIAAYDDRMISKVAASGQALDKPVERLAKRIYSQQLYAGLNSPDLQTQRRAFVALGQYIYRIAFYYMKRAGCPAELAEDCTQEALMLLHKYMSNIQAETFLGYVIKTVNTTCGRAAEKSKRELEQDPETNYQPIDFLSGPVSPSAELLECLMEAITRLPNKNMRLILILEHFSGLSDTEISSILELSKSNLQVLRHRARRKLQSDSRLVSCLQGN